MTVRNTFLPPDVHQYVQQSFVREPDVLKRLREATASRPEAEMQISPEQGQLMGLLVRLIGAVRCIELGTYTGYSALSVALALPPNGKLIACDVSDEWTSVGRKYWDRAGVADRIELRIAPAVETLRALPKDRSIDLAFIDADKPNYVNYYEELVPRMRANGLILVDNVLWSGAVVDPRANDENVEAIRRFNDHLAADPRVDAVMVPISDGLTLARIR